MLTPLRVAAGGNEHIRAIDRKWVAPTKESSFWSSWVRVAMVVVAIVALPFECIGAILKSACLYDEKFRAFCVMEASQLPSEINKMYQYVHSTHEFVEETKDQMEGNKLHFKPLELYECSCSETGAYNRLNNSRRNDFENAIVSRFMSIKHDKAQAIRLLDMGSGGLMSIFFILQKLVLAGFKNIDVCCVDPIIKDNSSEYIKKLQKIQKFFYALEVDGLRIKMQSHYEIDQCPLGVKYDAVLAIDYDGIFEVFDVKNSAKCVGDLRKAYDALDKEGFLALGKGEDSLSGPGINEPVIVSAAGKGYFPIQGFIADLAQRLPEKDSLSVGIPEQDFPLAPLYFYALSLAIKKVGKQYKSITISYNRSSMWSNATSEIMTMLQALFHTTISYGAAHASPAPSGGQAKLDMYFTFEPLRRKEANNDRSRLSKETVLCVTPYTFSGISVTNTDNY